MSVTQSKLNLDLLGLRSQFPILQRQVNGNRLVYLDSAATSQKPTAVLEAVDQFYREHNANIHRGVHTLSQEATDLYEQAREFVRLFLNASSLQEIILTKGCTEAINLVAHGLTPNIKPDDVILVSEMEHHSNIVPWQLLAERTGAKVLPIPISDEGEISISAYENLLQNNRVRIVAITHVSNALGTVNPIKQMVLSAHDVGALVLVDGAQAGPHHLVDVTQLEVDFYTLSCHKIYAPTGVGVLFGRHELLEKMPPYQGGGDMIRMVSFQGTTYAPLPAKFEAGTPNISGVIGLGAAIRWLSGLSDEPDIRSGLEVTMPAIAAHERNLAQLAQSELLAIGGVRIVGTAQNKIGVVSFLLDSAHPHDIGTILDTDGVAIRTGHHCCMPLMHRFNIPATARASFALYNTEEDVHRLVESVKKVKGVFA